MKRSVFALFAAALFFASCPAPDAFVPGFSTPSTRLSASVVYLEGETGLTSAGATDPVVVGTVLAMDDVLTTAPGAFCEISIASDGEELSTVRMDESTTLRLKTLFDTAASGRVIDLGLAAGTILCRVRRLAAADLYAVSTTRGVFGVRGTEFAVIATEQAVSVAVTRGSVAIFPPELEPARLAAGFGESDSLWSETVGALLSGAPLVEAGQEKTVTEDAFSDASETAQALIRDANALAQGRAFDAAAVRDRVEAVVSRMRRVAPAGASGQREDNSASELGRRGTYRDSFLMEMVFVEGGNFLMGSDNPNLDVIEEERNLDKPVHSVTVSGYWMGKFEVTRAQYHAIMDVSPSAAISASEADNRPIEVPWNDAIAFCNALSDRDGLEPAYTINGTDVDWNRNANGYRLPTEAEWEFAARGGNISRGYRYAGSDDPDSVAWYWMNTQDGPHPVGLKLPNELGFYDMSGNVGEYCWDFFAPYGEGESTDPTGPSDAAIGRHGVLRVYRDGTWMFRFVMPTTGRAYAYQDGSYGTTNGFRLVRSE